MASAPLPWLSPAEYLAAERQAQFRSEYHDGEMLAMSGGTRAHSRICVNVSSALHPWTSRTSTATRC